MVGKSFFPPWESFPDAVLLLLQLKRLNLLAYVYLIAFRAAAYSSSVISIALLAVGGFAGGGVPGGLLC